MDSATIHIHHFETPLGEMTAGVQNDRLCLLEFSNADRMDQQITRINSVDVSNISTSNHPLFSNMQQQLDAYFSGTLQAFDLPLDLSGSDFHEQTWRQLQSIPYGQTISYLELARRLGDPNKVRAVGRANGANRIAIVIPCHRVIGKDGSLTGYAGELWRKKKLLDLEALHAGHAYQTLLEF